MPRPNITPAAAPSAWWCCPNDPPCEHALHDIEDYDDPRPMCCTDACPCGKAAPTSPAGGSG